MRETTVLVAAGVIAFFLLICNSPALGQGQVFWQENGVLVCDGTFGGGSWPLAIAEDGSGGAIIAWADTRGTYESLYAQRLGKDGNCLWAPNGICLRDNTWFPDKISAVSDGRSGAIVVWEDDPGIGVPPQVRAQRVDSNGVVRWGPQGIVVAWDTADAWYWPSLVTDGQGGAIVAWVAEKFDTAIVCSLYAQRVDSSGALRWVSGGVLVGQDYCLNYFPEIAGDGQFGAIIAWSQGPGGAYDIYAQRLDSSGSMLWTPGGIPVCVAESIQAGPAVQCDPGTAGVIAWHDKRDGNWDIYAQRITPDGTLCWDADGVAICSNLGGQRRPRATSTYSGGTIVVWIDDASGVCDVYAQAVDSSGVHRWDSSGIFVESTSSPDGQRLAVVRDNQDGAVIVWRDLRASNWDIYCQRVDSSGVLRWGLGALAVCSDPENQDWGPVTVEDSSGGAIIAWGDRRPPGPGASIYAQRVGDAVGVKEAANDQLTMTNDQFLRIYPNPFGAATTIRYAVQGSRGAEGQRSGRSNRQRVNLSVYDLSGRLVRTLVQEPSDHSTIEPSNEVAWDGKDGSGRPVGSGVYFCKLTTAQLQSAAKMTLLK